MAIFQTLRRSFVPVLAMLLMSSSALAQSATVESRLRDKLRLQAQELQSLKSQQAGHQAALTAAQKERDDLKAKVTTLGNKPAAPSRGADREANSQMTDLRRRAESAEQKLAQTSADLAKWQSSYEELRAQAQGIIDKQGEAARAPDERLTAQLASKDQQLDGLYQTATEIADLYKNEAFMTKVRGGGLGLLGYSSVKAQNQLEIYRKKLYDQRFPKEVPVQAEKSTATEQPPQ
jgi:colicin import membrane protein